MIQFQPLIQMLFKEFGEFETKYLGLSPQDESFQTCFARLFLGAKLHNGLVDLNTRVIEKILTSVYPEKFNMWNFPGVAKLVFNRMQEVRCTKGFYCYWCQVEDTSLIASFHIKFTDQKTSYMHVDVAVKTFQEQLKLALPISDNRHELMENVNKGLLQHGFQVLNLYVA